MDFTDPYFESDQAVLVRAGFTALTCEASVCTAGDLDGFSIATQVLQALQTSAVDLVVIDKPAGDGIVAQNPTTFKLAGAVETTELYGFAVANNDPSSLVAAMNVVLRDIRSDGTYDDIVDRWF